MIRLYQKYIHWSCSGGNTRFWLSCVLFCLITMVVSGGLWMLLIYSLFNLQK